MNRFSRINPEEVRQRLANLTQVGDKYPQILALYLFGSFYRGSENELSDVDIAVLLTEPSTGLKEAIETESMNLLQVDELDTVFLDEAPPAFINEILSNSKRIFCRDSNLVAEFEASAMLEYLDLEPLLALYTQTQMERIRNGGLGENVYQTRSERCH